MKSILFGFAVSVLAFSCNIIDEGDKPLEIQYSLLINTKTSNGYNIIVLKKDLTISSLTEGGFNVDPEWSPDGNKIAYWTSFAGGLDDIIVMNEDGSDKRNLTNSAAWFEERPVWSPDGSMIAYDMLRTEYGIGVMQADGSNQKFVIPGERYNTLVWDVDGVTLIFSKRKGEKRQIFSVRIDGSSESQLTNDPTRSYSTPSISPNGRYLSFLENDGGSSFRIINRDRVTGEQISISEDGFGVLWSPDAVWMYFSERSNQGQTMYRVHPDGTSKENLSRKPQNSSYNDSVESITSDGSKVAFFSDRTGQWLLYVMNSNGSDQQFAFETTEVFHARWRPK